MGNSPYLPHPSSNYNNVSKRLCSCVLNSDHGGRFVLLCYAHRSNWGGSASTVAMVQQGRDFWKVVFWVRTPCGLVGAYQRVGRIYGPRDGGDMFPENSCNHLHHMASEPRRLEQILHSREHRKFQRDFYISQLVQTCYRLG
jgi:hypothetical protein